MHEPLIVSAQSMDGGYIKACHTTINLQQHVEMFGFLLPPPKKVMFSAPFVCWFACPSANPIFLKLG